MPLPRCFFHKCGNTKAWQEQTTRQFELAKQQNGALKGQVRSENRSDEPPYNSSLHGSKTS